MANGFRSLRIPLSADRYEAARQKADLASMVLQDVGVNRHGGELWLFPRLNYDKIMMTQAEFGQEERISIWQEMMFAIEWEEDWTESEPRKG